MYHNNVDCREFCRRPSLITLYYTSYYVFVGIRAERITGSDRVIVRVKTRDVSCQYSNILST